jgi:N-methylhydantoinase B
MNVNTIDNRTGRRVMAAIGAISGGAGGSPRGDGTEGSGANASFLKNTPVEINEAEVPFKILRYGLTQDSGGAGKYRGGNALEMIFQAHAPNTRVTARNRDRTRFSSWGVLGGKAGSHSRFVLNPGTNREENLGNVDILTIGPGDVVHIGSGGSGGWGDPLERDPAAVLWDVQRGFVSVGAAETSYGVILQDGAVDADATARRRADLARERPKQEGFFDYGANRVAYETVWTRANYDALTELLAATPVHWRFFVKHRVFEAVGKIDAAAIAGDGSDVRTAFDRVVESFPQLRAAMAA